MNTVRGSTASETKMIKAIQRAVGAAEDGLIGTATMSGLAAKVGAACWPVTLRLYGMPCIIARDITACSPRAGCGAYKNSLSGSFSWQQKPISILVSGGKVVCGDACHAWLDRPESVLYRLEDGTFGVRRCKSAGDLPNGVRWAVGGVGLGRMYDPEEEGFCAFVHNGKAYNYSDVLRKTNHTAIGVKNGLVYLVYCRSMTGAQVNAFCRDKLGLMYAIMLDGGHVAAMNGEESFARINAGQTQYYMIQAV